MDLGVRGRCGSKQCLEVLECILCLLGPIEGGELVGPGLDLGRISQQLTDISEDSNFSHM